MSLMRAIVITVGAVVVLLGLIWVFQRQYIYFPTQPVPDAATLVPGVEEVTYATEDGLSLSAWFIPAGGEVRGETVVVFNGNAGNRSHRVALGEALAERGLSVLLVDYRGYGGNQGSPSEAGLAADATAAVAYLDSRPDVDTRRLVYFGESLGAAVAVELATRRPPAALVLRSPFTSLAGIGSFHYPFLPVALLLRDRFPNVERIEHVEVPVLVIAGSADVIVPVDQSRQVYEGAPGQRRLLVIEGADHNDLALTSGDQLVDEMARFLEDMLP